mmetsp:Transcript_3150/g.6350  ORF Transcript_3150/g.6350 Transcript_3150/m.6350 type:complete len:696 (+) Transcript_3150:110-2197(+)|eukprot:CAMPEP_0181332022 /NCGR_PEP_ID=MMETSP1101-20121128/24846_1 /TAXON_ID=46948 /ORGANISM="Rhodomonas abbreviata, Strain Caron Lab Isolate" /LENGTH=695 /DNA_ID=CAMNT_0023441587 /DNA_START=112 /DNA_END=2199 /DNA_ORIENTATION=-
MPVRQKATRYRTEFDDDDGSAALLAAAMGPPAMCVVFRVPDEDEVPAEDCERITLAREKVIGTLRALNLNVDQYVNKPAGDKIFCKISAPDTMLRFEAESQGIRLRLKEEHGGALCKFSQELDERDAFDKALDGFELFSSKEQLFIIKEVIYSSPAGDDGEGVDDIKWQQLWDEPDKIVCGMFGLHHDRMRLKLLNEWARAYGKPQPLELIREYFGEKIALFYTWMGFYNTMLWIPGLVGLALFISQVYTYPLTNSLDNPFVPVFACVSAMWASMFCQLWKNLENTRKYQWDTLKFEDLEQTREEFKSHPKTQEDEHVNAITGELDDFYFDEGSYFPPTGRAQVQLVTYTVILILNIIAIMSSVFIWKTVAHPMMSDDDVMVGSILFSVLTTIIGLIIDGVMDGIAELGIRGAMHQLIAEENWMTDTDHEDSIIMKTFYFKFANKYMSLFFVAFGVNNVPLFEEFYRCPSWQCMPVLQVVFCTTVTMEILYSLMVAHLFPIINKYFDSLADNSALKAKAGKVVQKAPFEEQEEWLDATPVIDLYKDKVYQFGYISMFGVAFPMVTFLCLIFNLLDMRSRALTLLSKNKRPDPKVAADIGPYQQVLEVFATMSIITNSSICGITSYGLYFYFPEMTLTEGLWSVVILEHLLFIVRIFCINMIPSEPSHARLVWQTQQDRKAKMLEKWDLTEPEDEQ